MKYWRILFVVLLLAACSDSASETDPATNDAASEVDEQQQEEQLIETEPQEEIIVSDGTIDGVPLQTVIESLVQITSGTLNLSVLDTFQSNALIDAEYYMEHSFVTEPKQMYRFVKSIVGANSMVEEYADGEKAFRRDMQEDWQPMDHTEELYKNPMDQQMVILFALQSGMESPVSKDDTLTFTVAQSTITSAVDAVYFELYGIPYDHETMPIETVDVFIQANGADKLTYNITIKGIEQTMSEPYTVEIEQQLTEMNTLQTIERPL